MYKTLVILHSMSHDRDKIRRKYGGTYHISTPVEIDHRISPRRIFIVLVLLTRNYVSTLYRDHRKIFTVS